MFGFNYLGSTYFGGMYNTDTNHGTKAILMNGVWISCPVMVLNNGVWIQILAEVLEVNGWVLTEASD